MSSEKEWFDNLTISYIIGFTMICVVIWMIVKQMKEYYLTDDPMLQRLKDSFEKFFGQQTYWTGELQSLNNTIIYLLGHESYRKKIGKSARKTVIENFTIKDMSTSLKKVLERI